ncbi:von Willebrand factor C and EGF domain-containing protein isoform X2 [Nematostella vectensis]|uniref:von Willebrand factor C and EGF domain-containing protein isoform X2 n=1 Tax=Nematostella vectensis TaxID=45351 RepID=UPI0020774A6B|nr:von Willebrand factor C and EGF domain-containing protein isoform X2 [Nematostella vectensis]
MQIVLGLKAVVQDSPQTDPETFVMKALHRVDPKLVVVPIGSSTIEQVTPANERMAAPMQDSSMGTVAMAPSNMIGDLLALAKPLMTICSVPNPCGQQCYIIKIHGNYTCGCNPGFQLAPDKHRCTDINECHGPNKCSHGCNNTLGSYSCTCNKGFELGPDNHSCQEMRTTRLPASLTSFSASTNKTLANPVPTVYINHTYLPSPRPATPTLHRWHVLWIAIIVGLAVVLFNAVCTALLLRKFGKKTTAPPAPPAPAQPPQVMP